MRTDPPPADDQNEADQLYDRADYFSGAEVDPGIWMQMQKPIVDDICRFKSSGKLLDVGCGMGFLVKGAIERGFDAQGIDLNPHAVGWGRKHLAVPIEVRKLDTVPDGSQDIVVINHVLEHVPEIQGFLSELRSKLKDDGILVIGVPNLLGGIPRLLRLLNRLPFGPGANWVWFGYQFEQHLWHFTPASLPRLLERSGWEVSLVRTNENMVYGAVLLPQLKYRIARFLWSLFARAGYGDNLRVICRPARG